MNKTVTPDGTFVLSVRNNDPQKGDHVEHYKIHRLNRGNGFFIFQGSVFPTLSELVRHYMYQSINSGLCFTLYRVCPKENPNTIGLSKDRWEIPRKSLKLNKRRLGQGHFGDVWKGVYSNTFVAVKTLKKGTNMSQADFLAEANVMKKVRHEGIVQLYGVCLGRKNIYIVTELMSNGDLRTYLKSDKGKVTKLTTRIDMSAHIASGMDYLGSKNFVHRDLAASNVLVGEGNVVKIADFGSARLMEKGVYVGKKGVDLPIRWTAPEAFLHGTFTIKSDVWSFGILLTEIVNGGYPYDGMKTPEPVKEKVANGYRMPKMNDCPDSLYNKIMLKCWDKDPQQRPTFKFLHDYFVKTKPNYKEAD